jgi:YD repeat-containing protein
MDEILEPLISDFANYNPAEDLVAQTDRGYVVRALSRIARGRMTEAASDLECAKSLNPENGHVYMHLGNIYGSKNPERACQEYTQAAQLFAQQQDKVMLASAERSLERLEIGHAWQLICR